MDKWLSDEQSNEPLVAPKIHEDAAQARQERATPEMDSMEQRYRFVRHIADFCDCAD